MAPLYQSVLQHLLVIIIILASLASSTPAQPLPLRRHKRNIFQMCELIAHHTNRGCLDFNNYGCFCGLGNAASRHVDGIDGCCRVHDRCYGNVRCFWMYPQMVGYDVDCDENSCRCTDSLILSSCARTTCECDLAFAQCLGRNRFHHEFSNFDRRECNRPNRRALNKRERRRRRRRRRRRDISPSDQWPIREHGIDL